jgi:hypothetical protein
VDAVVDVKGAGLEGLAVDVEVASLGIRRWTFVGDRGKKQKTEAAARAQMSRRADTDLVLMQMVVDVLLDVVVGRVGVIDGLVVDRLVGHCEGTRRHARVRGGGRQQKQQTKLARTTRTHTHTHTHTHTQIQ